MDSRQTRLERRVEEGQATRGGSPGGQTWQEGKSVGYAGGAPVSGFPTMSGPVTAAL